MCACVKRAVDILARFESYIYSRTLARCYRVEGMYYRYVYLNLLRLSETNYIDEVLSPDFLSRSPIDNLCYEGDCLIDFSGRPGQKKRIHLIIIGVYFGSMTANNIVRM